jgi:5S rRNA maturation endonuclease (ribonuclease M5)
MGVGADKTILYGADDLLNDIGVGVVTTVVVCAGEYDALLLRQYAPGHVAVVTPGSESGSRIRQEWIGLMTDRRVILCMDADAVGGAAAQKWKSTLPRAEIVAPPNDAKDITDAWKVGVDLGAWLSSFT